MSFCSRRGDVCDGPRATGVRRADRGIQRRSAAGPRSDDARASGGRDDRRWDIRGPGLLIAATILPVLRRPGLERWRGGAALLGAARLLDRARDRLADARPDRD